MEERRRFVAVSADAWCACGRWFAAGEEACKCGGPARSSAQLLSAIARAFERAALVEALCAQCGSSLSDYRWRRAADRFVCESCTGTSGMNFLAKRSPSAAVQATIPGLRAVLLEPGLVPSAGWVKRGASVPSRVLLEIDRASFVLAVEGAGEGASPLLLGEETLPEHARSADPGVRGRVVQHAAVSPEILSSLAADPEPLIRLAVAAHRRTPPAALQALASDPELDVRLKVAKHKRTPPEVLAAFAESGEPKLRAAAAAHHATPLALLLRLVETGEKPVLKALANREFPIDELSARLKKLGYSAKQPKRSPYDTSYEPSSGLTFEEWLRAMDESHRH